MVPKITPAGIDVSKDWFNLALIPDADFKKIPKIKRQFLETQKRKFDRTPAGLALAQQWILSLGIQRVRVAIEPTGRYYEPICEYFRQAGHTVVLAQPLKFKKYAESWDTRGQNDSKDGALLAHYSKERGEQLAEWSQKTDVQLALRDLSVVIRSLIKRSTQIQCQLECGLAYPWAIAELKDDLKSVNQRLKSALKQAKSIIQEDPILSVDAENLLSIKGIGWKSAVLLLTTIDFRSFSSSRKLACFLGLTKRHDQSGHYKGKEPLSKRGSKLVRGQLFMPARVARRFNPLVMQFAKGLKSREKHDWTIQMAVIRKIVTISWSVVVKGQKFDPNYVNPHKVKSPT